MDALHRGVAVPGERFLRLSRAAFSRLRLPRKSLKSLDPPNSVFPLKLLNYLKVSELGKLTFYL